ncbi:MAG: hypothetical protein P8123_06585 [bacterium]
MKVDTLAHVKNQLSRVVDTLGCEPLFITRNGRVVAVMQAISSDEIEDYMLRNSKRFWSLIESRRRQAERGEVIPFEPERYGGELPAVAERTIAREKRGRYKRKR